MCGRLACLVVWLLLGTAAAAGAQEVGMAIVVQPRVRAHPPRGERSYELQKRNLIERGLKVSLQDRDSVLKVAFTEEFGCKRVTFSGQRTAAISGVLKLLGPSEMETEDPLRPCEPRLKLNLGKLWLALAPGEPPVYVETPTLVAGVKGTYLRILVDPALGTFLAVDEGTVTVQAKAGGPEVEVAAGRWVLVPPGGLPTQPAPLENGGMEFLDEPPLLESHDVSTEPPEPPQ